MKDDKQYILEGYRFNSEEEVKLAKADLLKINQIEDKMDYRNPHMMLAVYNKIIESRLLKTPIGYNYLKNIQKHIVDNPLINEEIQPIQIEPFIQQKESERKTTQKIIIDPRDRMIKKVSLIINAIFLILIIGMFIISSTSNKPTIINYEQTIQNKYASWEQELKEREAVIREKERQLLIEK